MISPSVLITLTLVVIAVVVVSREVHIHDEPTSDEVQVSVTVSALNHTAYFTVFLFSDTVSNLANNIIVQKCTVPDQATIHDGCEGYEDLNPSLNAATETVRNLRVLKIVSRAGRLIDSFDTPKFTFSSFDNYHELYALTHIYDYLPPNKRKCLCVFGSVQISTLMLILNSNFLDEDQPVRFFTESMVRREEESAYWNQVGEVFELYDRKKEHHVGNFANSLRDIKAASKTGMSAHSGLLCDAIHVGNFTNLVLGKYAHYPAAIIALEILTLASSSRFYPILTVTQSSHINLIQRGLQYKKDGQPNEDDTIHLNMEALRRDRLFDKDKDHHPDLRLKWKLMNLWPSISKFNLNYMPSGFSTRNDELNKEYLSLVTLVQIGSAQLQESHHINSNSDSFLGERHYSSSWSNMLSRFPCICITFTAQLFRENALGLQEALLRLGHENVRIVATLSYRERDQTGDSMGVHSHSSDSYCSADCVQIAIGLHDNLMLLPNYVLFQMEQTAWSQHIRGSLRQRYYGILAGALAILDYSSANADYMRKEGFHNIFVVPLYSVPVVPSTSSSEMTVEQLLDGSLATSYNDPDAKAGAGADRESWNALPSVDMLFYGSCTMRRQDWRRSLQEQLNKANNYIYIRDLSDETQSPFPPEYVTREAGGAHIYTMFFRCASSQHGWNSGVYGEVLRGLVSRAKVVINIHGEEGSTLEAHRINNLLPQGKCIVQEKSKTEPALDAWYGQAGAVVLAEDLGRIFEMAKVLVDKPNMRSVVEQRARNFHEASIKGNVTVLGAAMGFVAGRLYERNMV